MRSTRLATLHMPPEPVPYIPRALRAKGKMKHARWTVVNFGGRLFLQIQRNCLELLEDLGLGINKTKLFHRST